MKLEVSKVIERSGGLRQSEKMVSDNEIQKLFLLLRGKHHNTIKCMFQMNNYNNRRD